jgi:hypothetical protein
MLSGFWDLGYEVIHDLIDARALAFARAAMEFRCNHGRMGPNTGAATGPGLQEYGAVASEALLRNCQTKIEAVVAQPLIPAYSFWRIYEAGAALARHSDRKSCEISASLMIHAEPAGAEWPIWVEDLAGTKTAVPLRMGSAIIYQGHRVPHWREPFSGEKQFQVFLHHVRRDGEFADHAFDKRTALNLHT